MIKETFKIGDWVTWHSKTRKRWITGQIVNFTRTGKAYIIWTTWDGLGHHWIKPLSRLKKVASLTNKESGLPPMQTFENGV